MVLGADRRRYFEIARGSALACAAIQDVLVVEKGLDKAESRQCKGELDRITALLSRLGGRGDGVKEGFGENRDTVFDPDPDPDPDSDSDLDEM